MLVCGPFCAVCNMALPFLPCPCQWIGMINYDVLSKGALQLAAGMPVTVSNMLIYSCGWRGVLSYVDIFHLAQRHARTYSDGVIVVHALKSQCFWFGPFGERRLISLREALWAVHPRCRLLLFVLTQDMSMLHLHILRLQSPANIKLMNTS